MRNRRNDLLGPRKKESFLSRQSRRVRTGAASELSRGNVKAFDIRDELIKGMVALLPAALSYAVAAPQWMVIGALGLGASLWALWTGFVLWHWYRVAIRHGNRTYNLVTRKHLSKEYRDG